MIKKLYWIFLGSLFAFSIHQNKPIPFENWPAQNEKYLKKLDSQKIELGRELFYDPLLSLDSSISCASCHNPYNAFAHSDHNLSHGLHDSIGRRNAPALFNLAWMDHFMWDGAIHHIEAQALFPLTHPNEMGMQLEELVFRLEKNKKYSQQFSAIFSEKEIKTKHIVEALGQFQLSLISNQSKYDSVAKGLQSFTEQEQRGYELFQKNCNNCHTEPLFTRGSFENNSLSPDPILLDSGRYLVSLDTNDIYLFKVPTLRNLRYSFPYMHDGRFQKLSEVLHFYTNEEILRNNKKTKTQFPVHLQAKEKVDIIAFLNTLNDSKFIYNKKHSYPFHFMNK